ncbi:MAG: YbjN domain-containing protein [Stellaceae bacterium]
MTSLSMVNWHSAANPIDLAEEIVLANQWAHDRASNDELVVEISGKWSDYRLLFLWQREIAALHFSCSFEMKVPKMRRPAVLELLAGINERLWLGHFDLVTDDYSPAFRQGVLLRGAGGASAEQIEDLVDIAVTECERFYPAFQLVVWGGRPSEEAIAAAMIDPVGEA